eukprot:2778102-Amphidinium_carterae.1
MLGRKPEACGGGATPLSRVRCRAQTRWHSEKDQQAIAQRDKQHPHVAQSWPIEGVCVPSECNN